MQIRAIIDELDLEAFRGGPPDSLKIEIDEMYIKGEPILVRAYSEEGQTLSAIIESLTSYNSFQLSPLVQDSDGWQAQEISQLEPGAYRITIKGMKEGGDTISDVFLVV